MNNNEKTEFRKQAREILRENASERNWKSDAIWENLGKIEAFRIALPNGKLMTYIDFDHEVETARFLPLIFIEKVVIPHCEDDEIVPYNMYSLDELEPGRFGIPELEKNLRKIPRYRAAPEDISVVLVPGLAFDIHGNRLGRGKGYYDRFLSTLPESAITIGLAFECQVFDRIPVSPNDRPVSMLVTEERILP